MCVAPKDFTRNLMRVQTILLKAHHLRESRWNGQDWNAAREVGSVVDLSDSHLALRVSLREHPDIVVSTPSRLVEHLKAGNITIKTLQFLVVDEADLILSYGYPLGHCLEGTYSLHSYEEDIRAIAEHLPRVCQGFLMSATLNPEVDNLKQLVLHTPAVLKLSEAVQKKQVRTRFRNLHQVADTLPAGSEGVQHQVHRQRQVPHRICHDSAQLIARQDVVLHEQYRQGALPASARVFGLIIMCTGLSFQAVPGKVQPQGGCAKL
jgi:hypothetical protein